jgi:hypothetical protein
MLDVIRFKIEGAAPLLMHNGQLADPGNQWAKALKNVSSKRNKTDDDFAEMARTEWLGGLYLDESGAIAIPADVLLGCVLKGGKQFKLGPKINAGVFEIAEHTRLDYDGPNDLLKLYEAGTHTDSRLVVVQRNRIMRTRPIFRQWSLEVGLNVNTDVVDVSDVEKAIVRAGEVIGMGDYRPRYGRFLAERI